MNICIVGGGKVGYTLAQQLSSEGHDIVIVDSDFQVLQRASSQLDVMTIRGNGASMETLKNAYVGECDLIIAATSSDEINILCCIIARRLGCKHTIARVRNPEYDSQMVDFQNDLGLSMTINPERAAAMEIFRLLQFPSFLKRDTFYKSRVEIVEVKLASNSPLCGLSLMQLPQLIKATALICAVERNGDIIIPSGSFVLNAGDKINLVASTRELVKLIKLLGIEQQKIRSVVIVGGSRITAYLARELIMARVSVKIIEESLERCNELAEALPEALIINGDGTNKDLLMEEGLPAVDAAVTLTGIDEENIVLSLYCKHMGVKKTVTKVNHDSYIKLFGDSGIDSVISPKQITANVIVRYVRAMANSGEGSVQTLHRIVGGKVEALEFEISSGMRCIGIPIMDLKIKKGILVAGINRKGKVIIPKGQDTFEVGDSIIIVTLAGDQPISDLGDIFRES